MQPDRCGDGCDEKYPILNSDWRIEGPIDPLAHIYLDKAKQSFSSRALLDVMNVCSQLLTKFLDVRLAARHIQEVHMRSNVILDQNARKFLSSNTVLAEKIADIHERGAMPFYEGGEPSGPRNSGFPYGDRKRI